MVGAMRENQAQPFEKVFESIRQVSADASMRTQAFEKFCELGIPTTKNEDWKYTNIVNLGKLDFRAVNTASVNDVISPESLSSYFCEGKGARLVFLDGVFQESMSDPKSLKIERKAPQIQSEETSSLAYLNAALALEELTIRIPKKTQIKDLVQIVYLVSGTKPTMTATPESLSAENQEGLVLPVRLSIIAEEESSLQLVETFVGLGSDRYFSSVYTDIICEAGSNVEHTKVQIESKNAYHVSKLKLVQKEKSKFTSNVFSFGGGTVRNEIHPELDGERIESYLNGLTIIRGNQHVDNTTVIDHAKPNCFSRELYKGVYAEKAKGVFSGTIIVRPDAQKTNAIQSNKSILLSESASIETRPQLKIWADDVKCTHGATVGQLDEDAHFYLRSRGIPEKQAQMMLLQAFVGDIVLHVADESLRKSIEQRVQDALLG